MKFALVYDRYKYLPIKSADIPANISVNQDISAYRCCVISVLYRYLYRQIRKKCHIGHTLPKGGIISNWHKGRGVIITL